MPLGSSPDFSWPGRASGRGRALGVDEVKFTGQVLPTNKVVRYHVHIRRVINRKLVMAISDGSVFVDDREIYTMKNMRVGIFADDSDSTLPTQRRKDGSLTRRHPGHGEPYHAHEGARSEAEAKFITPSALREKINDPRGPDAGRV